jgi:hypothetical protein
MELDNFVTNLIQNMEGDSRSMSAILVPLFVDTSTFWGNFRKISKGGFFLGPYSKDSFLNPHEFKKQITTWMVEQGLFILNDEIEKNINESGSLSIYWEYVRSLIDTELVQRIYIGFDNIVSNNEYKDLYDFFRIQRKFCTEWDDDKDLSINFVSIGNWIPSKLEKEFKDENISWPFHKYGNLF